MRLKSKRARVAVVLFTALTVLLLGGTLMFHHLEHWTWVESFYFTVVTVTTVGYGDLHPTTDVSRLFTALFILLGVSIGAGILSYFGSNAMKRRVNKHLGKLSDE